MLLGSQAGVLAVKWMWHRRLEGVRFVATRLEGLGLEGIRLEELGDRLKAVAACTKDRHDAFQRHQHVRGVGPFLYIAPVVEADDAPWGGTLQHVGAHAIGGPLPIVAYDGPEHPLQPQSLLCAPQAEPALSVRRPKQPRGRAGDAGKDVLRLGKIAMDHPGRAQVRLATQARRNALVIVGVIANLMPFGMNPGRNGTVPRNVQPALKESRVNSLRGQVIEQRRCTGTRTVVEGKRQRAALPGPLRHSTAEGARPMGRGLAPGHRPYAQTGQQRPICNLPTAFHGCNYQGAQPPKQVDGSGISVCLGCAYYGGTSLFGKPSPR